MSERKNPVREAVQVLQDENDRLRARVAELEQRLFAARNAAFSEGRRGDAARRAALLEAAAACKAEHDSVNELPDNGEGSWEQDLYIPGYQDGCDDCEYRIRRMADEQPEPSP